MPPDNNPNIVKRVEALEDRYTEDGLNTETFPISDAVDSDRSDIAASSKAVKAAHDAGTRYATTTQQGQVILTHDVESGAQDRALTPFGAKTALDALGNVLEDKINNIEGNISSKLEEILRLSGMSCTLFTRSGTYVTQETGMYLIIGTGGGGGGAGVWGTFGTSKKHWGGAGGIECLLRYLTKGQSYAVTVGKGGAGGPGVRDNVAEAGTDSAFADTLLGGGGGRGENSNGVNKTGAPGRGFLTMPGELNTGGYNFWGVGENTGHGGAGRFPAEGNGEGHKGQDGNVLIIRLASGA